MTIMSLINLYVFISYDDMGTYVSDCEKKSALDRSDRNRSRVYIFVAISFFADA